MVSTDSHAPSPKSEGTVAVPAGFFDQLIDRLDRVEQRLAQLDRVEARLDAVATPVEQAPKLVAAMTDTVDSWTMSAQARGVDVDASLTAATRLLEKAVAADNVARIERIIDRLDTVESSLTFAEQLPGVAAMAGDIADNWIARTEGLDLDATLKAAIPALTALADPKVVAAVETLAKRAPELAALVDSGPKLVAAAVDTVDGMMGRLVERGTDLQAMSESVAVGLSKLGDVLNSPQYLALMNSGVLDPSTLDMVGKAGSALVHARLEACVETGMFGALRATSDKDIQRAIGFAIKFAQAFGQELAQPDNLKHLAAQGEKPQRLPAP